MLKSSEDENQWDYNIPIESGREQEFYFPENAEDRCMSKVITRQKNQQQNKQIQIQNEKCSVS